MDGKCWEIRSYIEGRKKWNALFGKQTPISATNRIDLELWSNMGWHSSPIGIDVGSLG